MEEMYIVCPCGGTAVDINEIFGISFYTTDGLSNTRTEPWLAAAFTGDANNHSTKDLLTMCLEHDLIAKEMCVCVRI